MIMKNLYLKLMPYLPKRKAQSFLLTIFSIMTLLSLALNTPVLVKMMAKNAVYSNNFVTYQAINLLNERLEKYKAQGVEDFQMLRQEIEESIRGELHTASGEGGVD